MIARGRSGLNPAYFEKFFWRGRHIFGRLRAASRTMTQPLSTSRIQSHPVTPWWTASPVDAAHSFAIWAPPNCYKLVRKPFNSTYVGINWYRSEPQGNQLVGPTMWVSHRAATNLKLPRQVTLPRKWRKPRSSPAGRRVRFRAAGAVVTGCSQGCRSQTWMANGGKHM